MCKNYVEEGDRWKEDGYYNRTKTNKWNIFNERESLTVTKNSVCNQNLIEFKNKNLTITQKVVLFLRDYSFEEETQYMHHLHYKNIT